VVAEHVSGSTVLDSTTSPLQPAANRKLQFPGLQTGQSYRFKVCAVNAIGDSVYAGPTNTVGAW